MVRGKPAEDKGPSNSRQQGECATDTHSYGQQVAVVDQFVYLGSVIHLSTQSTPDIIWRSAITCAAIQRV